MHKKTLLTTAALILLSLVFQFALYWPSGSAFLGRAGTSWRGAPLLSTPDGYYYLRLAREEFSGTYTETDPLRPYSAPERLPLLSALTAHLAKWTGLELRAVGFYLPPVLASTLILVAMGMGTVFGSLRLGLLAFLFMSTTPMWFYRTLPGSLDTDGLNLVLVWGGLCLGTAMRHGSWRQRTAFACCWVLTDALLCLWWPQAGAAFAALSAGILILGATVEHRLYLDKRFLVAGAVCVVLAAAFFLYPSFLPTAAGRWVQSLRQHIALLTAQQDTLFVAVGKTISELRTISFLSAVRESSGHLVLFFMSVIGMAHAFRKNAAALYLLLPGIFFFLISFVAGGRFLMFCAPAFGVGIAWFLLRTLPAIGHIVVSDFTTSKGVLTALTVVLLAYAASPALRYKITLRNDGDTVALLNMYRLKSPKGSPTWNWWGPGYFIQYFAQRPTYIDGGSQTSERAFISAVPYASASPQFSRNWIKFFTAHPDGIEQLTHDFGGRTQAIRFLLCALRQPVRLPDFLRKFRPVGKRNWRAYLYPKTSAYIVVLHDMLFRGSWLPIGRWTPDKPTTMQNTTIAYSSVTIDRDSGTLLLQNDTAVKYSKIYFITPHTLSHDPVRAEGPVAIFVQGAPFVFVLPQQYFNAVAFRLLFISPDSVPGFTPVAYHPYIGGVWKVE